ncbi:hypothetical protein K7640_01875 [Micromonospora sp. PLK6-60]|uniref:DUF6623 family protein n=1 Tax=Micromonospora sp. PLK6-60 TaxID=2873383 RepID=UPI001CA72A26|nr:DUF6623 family protein [Micromonospora sp. PLK6-60]MBY8870588.1 hypothetical protein [Micromonospora sp. PLK6-60]
MALEQAMWAHGHSLAVEFPDRIRSEWRAGFFIRLVGRPGTTNWLHFGIPTPVIVNDNRLAIDSALIRFRCETNQAAVTNVHVFDGEKRIAAHDNLSLAPSTFGMQRFAVPGRPEVLWGVGLTLGVRFTGTTDQQNTMEISSAGVDFFP